MRLRLRVMAGVLPVLLALAGCQMVPGRSGPDAAASAASPITGDAIAVTSLDAPSSAGPVSAPTPAEPAPAAPSADAVAVPDPAASADPAAAEPPAAEPPAPVVVKSPAQMTCERRGGRWSVTGGGVAAFCQTPTRDGGKTCSASTDCTGYCLEKSRTCAPVSPMLGCHDILNEAGRMLTQCIN